VLAEVRAIIHHSRSTRYDLNGDGRVNWLDLAVVVRQLGRRCQ
jgi:hypothetical protein